MCTPFNKEWQQLEKHGKTTQKMKTNKIGLNEK
jgi:hypothetical protein